MLSLKQSEESIKERAVAPVKATIAFIEFPVITKANKYRRE
jgi:hypothetical protein